MMTLEAAVHLAKGEFAPAEAGFLRVLASRLDALGPEHPLTVESMHNLGVCLFATGEWERAVAVNSTALESRLGAFGIRHADTISSTLLLARSQMQLGEDHAEAESVVCHAIDVMCGMGTDDALHRGDRVLASDHLQLVVDIASAALGPEHAKTVACRARWASVRYNADAMHEPLRVLEDLKEVCTRVLGQDSEHTIKIINLIGRAHADNGDLERAEPLLLASHQAFARVLGVNDPATLVCAEHLANFYLMMGVCKAAWADRLMKANSLAFSALRRREDAYGEDHQSCLGARMTLAMVMLALGKDDHDALTALNMIEAGVVDKAQRLRGPEHPVALQYRRAWELLRRAVEAGANGAEAAKQWFLVRGTSRAQ